ncbi:MFS transporter [Elizabethkingia anophelis]|nr:MFS transporter [Elizabethkingia anophelis]
MNEKIRVKEKLAYGLGDAASSMFWKIFSMYLLFFYTDVFGITAATSGTMFLVTKVWDAFFDPVVGLISDRVSTRWGKFRPFLVWMVLPFAIMGIFTFFRPDFSENGRLVYAYITYSVMMMVYSLINVPYASLLGVISSDPKERTALASYRMVFAFIGSLIALWLIEPLVKIFGDETLTSAMGWVYAMVVFGIIASILFLLCFAGTKERITPVKENNSTLKNDLKDLFANKPWWILLGAGVATLLFNTIRDGVAIYYFKYYLNKTDTDMISFFGMQMSLTTAYLVLGQAANIIGVVAATPVANKIGKKKTFFFAMLFAAIFSILFYFLEKSSISEILVLQFIISICAGSIFPLLWSMYADTADYSEWKQGRRATGLVFSASSMSQKLGWAIGGWASGSLLAFFGFQANVLQTTFAQTGIKLMLSLLPATAAIISMLFILFYPLHEKQMKIIEQDLEQKRN